MNNLQSFSNFTEHCGCDHSEDKKKKSKVTKEEIIKEYGDPTVSKRLRVARAIDSTFRGKAPKYNSKRAKISNALKMSSIKAETKKRKAKENPYSAGKKLKAALGINSEGYLPEEGYDIARDMGMVKPSKDKKDATTANHTRETETDAQRKLRMLKQQKNTARAVENVKQRLRDKYGKNAIMDVGKKNEEVEHLDELSKTTTANYLYHAKVDKNYVHGGKMGKYAKARDKGIQRAEKKLGKKVSDRVNYVADTDTRSMRQDSSTSAYPRKIKVKEEVQLEKVNLRDKSTQYARSTKEVDTAMTDHVNRTKGRHYGKDGKVTEVGRYRKPSKREARNELIDLYKESYGRGRLTSTNDMQSKLYAKNNSMGKPRTDDEIRKEKGGQAFLDRIKAAKASMKKEEKDLKTVAKELDSAVTKHKSQADKIRKHIKSMKSEGTSYGIYKGTGKPSGPMAAFAKKTKKKKEVKEEMGNIAHTKTKKGGKTIINVNKNDEADAQKAMKNDPKYILGKTRVQSYKEEFYQKRYTSSGYKPVGKNKRMDQSNKRSGDSKAQYRDLHKDLAKYGHVKTGKASNLKSGLKSFKESAWQRKEGKNPSGGLNEKGRKSYERENPGSDLKAPVTGSPKPGSKADKRQNNFCKRMGGMRGPMKDEKGRPTRKALALKKWNCRSS